MHLVIATREDPQLPLGRLRAQGQLTELRATDLCFTPGEAATFLNQVMGLCLSADEITVLENRTEGWIAGYSSQQLSMQGREDIPAFIGIRWRQSVHLGLSGRRGPAACAKLCPGTFLLQTSILDRLHGPLCNAVTSEEEGNARLESLERSNFFIVPLDDRRHWYRYHHLFAEVLSSHLRAHLPDQVATLHSGGRASGMRMDRLPMQSAMRWPPRISHGLRTLFRWDVQPLAGVDSGLWCWAG